MVERRKKRRAGSAADHPLAKSARLKTRERREKPRAAQRERVTFLLSSELVDRLRDAVYWTPGATLAGIVTESLGRTIDGMERARGEHFPRRKRPLKAGRPVK